MTTPVQQQPPRPPSRREDETQQRDKSVASGHPSAINAPNELEQGDRERFRRALQSDSGNPEASLTETLSLLDEAERAARLKRPGGRDDSNTSTGSDQRDDSSGRDNQNPSNNPLASTAAAGTPQPHGMGDLLRLMRPGVSSHASDDNASRYTATRQALDLELVISAVERLWTDADGGRHSTLMAELKTDTLPGVTLSLNDDGSTLWVAFQCHLKAPYERLGTQRYVLADKLAARLERDVMVQISHGRQATLEARGLYQPDDE
ncbi:hypothetical protein QS306_09205 [Paraburkholderia bonniea]|uniref:hypothetical protein n=1 Tax=Paraburkholderia bonniea TaxID=2152891 RepID=UPI001291DC15|nr:hypothetical protein [Paraburkholderia bonniea]WJF89300.1 hypothetical protein QS306_09205 [Paraburkholderia bonniea]WJF92616.1 hypothetical protein QS308_09215 [Paraburkholderia bonniea]